MVVNFDKHKLSPRGAGTKISSAVRRIWRDFGGGAAGTMAQLFNDK